MFFLCVWIYIGFLLDFTLCWIFALFFPFLRTVISNFFPNVFFQCSEAGVCLSATDCERDTKSCVSKNCVAGRSGLLCSECDRPNFVPVSVGDDRSCVECTKPNWLLMLFTALFGIAFLCYLQMSVTGSSSKLKILFYFAQMTSLLTPRRYLNLAFNTLDIRV